MLGLDALADGLIASLAAATGVQDPSPEGSAGEAKEVAALSTLVGLASGDAAGFLGGGWVTVLRTLSALDLLKVPLQCHHLFGRCNVLWLLLACARHFGVPWTLFRSKKITSTNC